MNIVECMRAVLGFARDVDVSAMRRSVHPELLNVLKSRDIPLSVDALAVVMVLGADDACRARLADLATTVPPSLLEFVILGIASRHVVTPRASVDGTTTPPETMSVRSPEKAETRRDPLMLATPPRAKKRLALGADIGDEKLHLETNMRLWSISNKHGVSLRNDTFGDVRSRLEGLGPRRALDAVITLEDALDTGRVGASQAIQALSMLIDHFATLV